MIAGAVETLGKGRGVGRTTGAEVSTGKVRAIGAGELVPAALRSDTIAPELVFNGRSTGKVWAIRGLAGVAGVFGLARAAGAEKLGRLDSITRAGCTTWDGGMG